MTLTPKEAFRNAYMVELAKQRIANPDKYIWPIEELPVIVDKMIAALERGGANIDSPAIKAACRMCKFKPSIGHSICDGAIAVLHVCGAGYPAGKGWHPRTEAFARWVCDAMNEKLERDGEAPCA